MYTYNFADRKRKKLQDSEFPSLGKTYEEGAIIDYSTLALPRPKTGVCLWRTVCKDGDDGVICETTVKKETIVLPMPPKRIAFPFKETYDWSGVPIFFSCSTPVFPKFYPL